MADWHLQKADLTPSSLSETKAAFLLCHETMSQITPPKSLPMHVLSRPFPGTVSWKMEDSSKKSLIEKRVFTFSSSYLVLDSWFKLGKLNIKVV